MIQFILILFSLPVFASSKLCFWQVCEIVDGQLSVCPIRSSGTEEVLEKADRESRRLGLVLNRECIEPHQKPALSWEGSGIFVKQSK